MLVLAMGGDGMGLLRPNPTPAEAQSTSLGNSELLCNGMTPKPELPGRHPNYARESVP
jgi:hypothetical protein